MPLTSILITISASHPYTEYDDTAKPVWLAHTVLLKVVGVDCGRRKVKEKIPHTGDKESID